MGTTATAREASRAPFNGHADPATWISFRVDGVPATAGSKRAFPFKRKDGTLGVNVTHDNKRSRPWMAAVASAARDAYQGELLRGPLELGVTFSFARPKGHMRTGSRAGEVRDSAPEYPAVKPDLSKLVRAVEDALRGVIFNDDAQIVDLRAGKEYSGSSCCVISIRRME